MSFIRHIKIKAYPTFSKHFSRTALVEGRLKNSGQYFRCLFVDNVDLKRYMIPRMYEDYHISIKNGIIATAFLKKALKRWSGSIDMCIAVLPSYLTDFEKISNFKTQVLIRSFIDTSNGWKGVKKQLYKKKKEFCNKMDRNPFFSCRISKDIKDFDSFYNDMHKPHIHRRYGELGEAAPYEHMKDLFSTGFVLLVKENDMYVAGGLCSVRNNTLYMHIAGILNGDEQYLKRGASYAQYYFTLKYALENGISRVDLVRSRPFFNDGVLTAKREWGAKVYPNDESQSWVHFFIPSYSQRIAHFFEMNPLIIFQEDKLYVLLGSSSGNYSADDEKKIYERYYSPEFHGLIILRPYTGSLIQMKPQKI